MSEETGRRRFSGGTARRIFAQVRTAGLGVHLRGGFIHQQVR